MARSPATLYWPKCSVCQYMKRHKDFRTACMNSTYFNPDGKKSLTMVNDAFGKPFKMPIIYAHMKRHQAKDIAKVSLMRAEEDNKKALELQALTNTMTFVETAPKVNEVSSHEKGLDDFIMEGRAKLKAGELHITAATFLQAVKIKAENEKGNKDRRLEALKTMFQGAAPKKIDG